MKIDILGIRVSRRAIGIVGISGEQLTFADSRYLTSRRNQAIERASRYIDALIRQSSPRIIAVYAPSRDEGVTRELADRLVDIAASVGAAIEFMDRGSLLSAFGVKALRTMSELAVHAAQIWPTDSTYERQPSVPILEAYAAALLGECRAAFSSNP